MPFGKLRRRAKNNRYLLVRLYFIVGSALIITLFILYSNMIIVESKKEANVLPQLFARYVSLATHEDFSDRLCEYVRENVIAHIGYPIIITDAQGNPAFWKNIDLPETLPYDKLADKQKEKLNATLQLMKDKNWVVPQVYGEQILGYTYYSESRSMRLLRLMPWLEVIIVLLFVLFGVWAIVLLKRSERDYLWVGLAKETAHQFGTPITSLLGWISVLRMRLQELDPGGDTPPMLDYMEADIERLNRVASRFGKVGSNIKRNKVNLATEVKHTIDYFASRLPHMSKQIKIDLVDSGEPIQVAMDADLIKWALENLIKNSIDAMKDNGGIITVSVHSTRTNAVITVQDEGGGIPKKLVKTIFEPGVTSKKRGWGLGLSLARRIVCEYHNGKIRVVSSVVGAGTIIEITLPLKEQA